MELRSSSTDKQSGASEGTDASPTREDPAIMLQREIFMLERQDRLANEAKDDERLLRAELKDEERFQKAEETRKLEKAAA